MTTVRPLPVDDALALEYDEDLAARAVPLHEALRRVRADEVTLAGGDAERLAATYEGRLEAARAAGLPHAGLEPLVAALRGAAGEPVWGFTVRDATMIYIAFAEASVSRLIGIAVLPARGSEAVLAG